MGLKTKEEYIESIKQMSPTAYMFGDKIDSVVDNPRLRAGIEATAARRRLTNSRKWMNTVICLLPRAL
jgi:4-hydroxybutyryl-CoA dehydratase/vinylacetyl-CoA-Delta-isomerase